MAVQDVIKHKVIIEPKFNKVRSVKCLKLKMISNLKKLRKRQTEREKETETDRKRE